jgi:hypothetical protein
VPSACVTQAAHEREVERGLLTHLRDLLLELGRGFAFMGSQVPLEVAGESIYLDLLFYHVRLTLRIGNGSCSAARAAADKTWTASTKGA